MPPNYREQRGTSPLAPHERRGAWILGATVLVAALGVGIWGVAEGGGPKGPCVTVVIAGSTGGENLQHCGGEAREWCAAEATSRGDVALQIQAACRRAGFLPH